jgi:hypothetical protein
MRHAILLGLVLAACTAEGRNAGDHVLRPGLSGSGIVLRDSCAASEFGADALIGRRADSIPFADFPFPVRVVRPGMAVTMDFSEARLTVETDAAGIITRASCG